MSEFPQTLTGRVIAVPESRSLDVFTNLLQRRGASVIQCPLVGIHNSPDTDAVLAWLRDFNHGACDDLILMTGEGLRRLLSIIDLHAPELREPFVQQLAKVRKITRGPKPNSELRKLGLERDINALAPTTEGVIETMAQLDLAGRTVGLQLYGTYENPPLLAALERQGAKVLSVAPYVYADDIEEQKVTDLISQIIAGQVDVIAFTSATQVKRLWSVANKQKQLEAMEAAFTNLSVTAVGPVVRDCLIDKGVKVDLMPEDSFFLKPLVKLLGDKLGPKT